MLGRPLGDRVAMRATMQRCRRSLIAFSSVFISHLAHHSIIPGDHLERDHLPPPAGGLYLPGSLGWFRLATDVEGPQVEVVNPLVNEQDHFLIGDWLAIGLKRETD